MLMSHLHSHLTDKVMKNWITRQHQQLKRRPMTIGLGNHCESWFGHKIIARTLHHVRYMSENGKWVSIDSLPRPQCDAVSRSEKKYVIFSLSHFIYGSWVGLIGVCACASDSDAFILSLFPLTFKSNTVRSTGESHKLCCTAISLLLSTLTP